MSTTPADTTGLALAIACIGLGGALTVLAVPGFFSGHVHVALLGAGLIILASGLVLMRRTKRATPKQ